MDLLKNNSIKIVGRLQSQDLQPKIKKDGGSGYISGSAVVISHLDGRDCEFEIQFYTNQLTKDGKQSKLYTSYSKLGELVGKKVEITGELRENRFFSKNGNQMASAQVISGRFVRGVAESTEDEASFEFGGFVVDALKEKTNKDGEIYRYDLVLGQANYNGDMMGRYTFHVSPVDVEIVRGVQKYQIGETVFVHGNLRFYVEKVTSTINNEGGFGEAVTRTYTNRQSNYFVTGGSAPIKDAEKGMYGSDIIRNLVSAYKARDVEIADKAKEGASGENDGGEKEVKVTSRQTSLI